MFQDSGALPCYDCFEFSLSGVSKCWTPNMSMTKLVSFSSNITQPVESAPTAGETWCSNSFSFKEPFLSCFNDHPPTTMDVPTPGKASLVTRKDAASSFCLRSMRPWICFTWIEGIPGETLIQCSHQFWDKHMQKITYIYMYVYECMNVWMNVCMYACMDVCMYVCMYVCM